MPEIKNGENSLEEILGEGFSVGKNSSEKIYKDLNNEEKRDKKAEETEKNSHSSPVVVRDLSQKLKDGDFAPVAPQHYSNKPRKNSAVKITAIILAVLIALGGGAYAFLTFCKKDSKGEEYYKNLYSKISDGEDKYSALAVINPEFTGYLTLPEKSYGYPVVSSESGADSYAERLFDKSESACGTLYTKAKAEGNFPDITVIHGNAYDGLMLSSVEKYLDGSYRENYPTISYDIAEKSGKWVVFSAFSCDKEPFLIDRRSFLTTDLKNNYILSMYDNSAYSADIDAEASDPLLVVVAEGEKNTVLAARLVREGEVDGFDSRVERTATVASLPDNYEKEEEEEQDKLPDLSKFEFKMPELKKPTAYKEQTGLLKNTDKTVKVKISNKVEMQNFVGMDKNRAYGIAESALGLKVTLVGEVSSKKKDTVISQSVSSGAVITTDVPLTLTYSKGVDSGKTIVPDLVGCSKSEAEKLISSAKLKVGKISYKKSSRAKNTVLSQSVEEGTKIAKKSKIDLVLSDGKGKVTKVTVPDITGLSREKAESKLKSAGLKVGTVSVKKSSKSAGTVLSQGISSGSSVKEGTAVDFTVSNGSKINDITVTNGGNSIKIDGKTYASGATIKGDYMDIIPCIVEAEMGEGMSTEALKAQAIAAYCWLINAGSLKGSAPNVPMKTPSEKVKKAAEAVENIRAYYNGEVAQTYYYAISAGYTANCKDIWSEDIPYLRSVKSEGDKNYSGFETTLKITASKLKSKIKKTYGVDLSGVDKSKWIKVTYDENKCYARSVSLGSKKTVDGSSIRDKLFEYELRSTAYKVKYDKSSDTFIFTVKGYGHGVGMSQVGADYYARKGWSYSKILKHYYPGITLK